MRRSGPLWEMRYRMAKPVEELLEFRRSHGTISATGSGSVLITRRGHDGCRIAAKLPFDQPLPRACS